jgi:gluconokinase
MIVVLMGVSGAGKTTVGRLLAEKNGWAYFDADDYHPQASIEKMHNAIALTDEDRWPWLDRLHDLIAEWDRKGINAVLGCSALKEIYRKRLAGDVNVNWVFLKADPTLIAERLQLRTGHFMSPALLGSQFQTLEEPQGAMIADARRTPSQLVEDITRALSGARDRGSR